MGSGFGNQSWPHENNIVEGVEHTDTHTDALVKDCSVSSTLAMGLQWNLSVTTTPVIKFITSDLFSNVLYWWLKVPIYSC